MAESAMAEKKKVVVIGGGVAGSAVAYGLQESVDLTLIDPKDYFEIPYPEPRSIVEPASADRTLLLYKDFLKNSKIVQSSATDATATEVTTESGETIPYDFLVIASGTAFTGPATKGERLRAFEEDNKKVKDGESVLVIGGGPVGVELAAEIITDFPKKKVTLVTGGDRTLEFLGPKAARKAEDWFKKKGVEVILKDHVLLENISPPNYETKNHVSIKADTHFLSIGKKIATGWIGASSYLKDALTQDGRVKMETTTQVVGFPSIFAAGDVTDYKEPKQGYLAEKHAVVVVTNIKKLIKNPKEKKLATYKAGSDLGIVTLGRVDAVAQLPFGTMIGWVPGKLKSKDFFVSKVRTERGLPAK